MLIRAPGARKEGTVSVDRRFVRGAVGNALVFGLALALCTVLLATGLAPANASWLGALALAVRAGVIGGIAGAAFAVVIRLAYRGWRLADIGWLRFALAAGIATAVFVPLFLQAMDVLSGDGMVPWRLLGDDFVLTAVLGAIVGGGSLKLAQLAAARGADALDGAADVPSLPPAAERHAR
jgi:hypothetical protein